MYCQPCEEADKMALGSSRHPVRRPVQALRHSPSEECRMHGRNSHLKSHKIAILWRGDAEARRAATPQNNRFHRIFEELEFMARCEPYFARGGCIVDQPFQPRLPDGMIRC